MSWVNLIKGYRVFNVDTLFFTVSKGLRGFKMTMGLKIHRMMKDKDPPELQDEARKRRELNDNVLDVIYAKLIDRRKGRESKFGHRDDDDDDL